MILEEYEMSQRNGAIRCFDCIFTHFIRSVDKRVSSSSAHRKEIIHSSPNSDWIGQLHKQTQREMAGIREEQSQDDRVSILSYSGVCVWKTVTGQNSETCAICRCDLSDLCLSCANSVVDADSSSAKQACTVAVGVCTHSFHSCCLRGWLERMQSCALCSHTWTTSQTIDRTALL